MYHPVQELDGRSRCGKEGACRLTSGALRDVRGAKISIRPLIRPNARRCAESSHHGRKDAGVRTSVPRFLHPVVARVGYDFDCVRGSSPTGDPVHRDFTTPLPSSPGLPLEWGGGSRDDNHPPAGPSTASIPFSACPAHVNRLVRDSPGVDVLDGDSRSVPSTRVRRRTLEPGLDRARHRAPLHPGLRGAGGAVPPSNPGVDSVHRRDPAPCDASFGIITSIGRCDQWPTLLTGFGDDLPPAVFFFRPYCRIDPNTLAAFHQ
jgi:hypothetical protein